MLVETTKLVSIVLRVFVPVTCRLLLRPTDASRVLTLSYFSFLSWCPFSAPISGACLPFTREGPDRFSPISARTMGSNQLSAGGPQPILLDSTAGSSAFTVQKMEKCNTHMCLHNMADHIFAFLYFIFCTCVLYSGQQSFVSLYWLDPQGQSRVMESTFWTFCCVYWEHATDYRHLLSTSGIIFIPTKSWQQSKEENSIITIFTCVVKSWININSLEAHFQREIIFRRRMKWKIN